jgi:hypothetical protein
MAAGSVEVPASAAAAVANFGMKVSPENILGLYAVVMEEVRRLELSLMNFQMRHQIAPKLGNDPVSAPAAAAFQEVTSQLLANCRRAIKELQTVAEGLARTARAYGNSEAQIKASFDPSKVQYTPTSLGSRA